MKNLTKPFKTTLSSFAIVTLGCKVNTYESNVMRNDLIANGLIEVDFKTKADVYIINTCSVTNTADSKSRNMIRRATHLNSKAIVIVAGCYSQVESAAVAKIDGVDIIIGNKYKNDINQLIITFMEQNKIQLIKVDNLLLDKEFENSTLVNFGERTRAFLKIQDGCNFMCSYCIIPFSRGRQRSKPLNTIIEEIKQFINYGYCEIVLTGVNTAGYLDGNNTFYDLLKTINTLPGKFRIRISSVEPFQIDHKIVDLICDYPQRFCQHWHICLQSGSDAVLKEMHRKYATNKFNELVKYIYSKSKYAAITTDYIVGFPTETLIDHEKSMNFCKEIKFMDMHVFPYSPRKNTAAAHFKQIDGSEMKRRLNDVLKMTKELQRNFYQNLINEKVVLDVIFETYENNIAIGHSSQFVKVMVMTTKKPTNGIHQVMPNKIFGDKIIGIIQ